MQDYTGKILRVNLTQNRITQETIDPDVKKKYIGGRGLGIYYLLKECDPTCDPLGEENPLIIAIGPLTGTGAPTGARYMVMTKSPLTGGITCSNTGGFLPTEMRRAGIEMIIFQGKSPEPVYLWVDNDHFELRPADHLWGKDTHKTNGMIREETHPKARVACIGPAGENRVLFAAIMNDDDRAAGRSGVGAVMGSKNLKAFAIKANGKIALYDKTRFTGLVKEFNAKFKDSLVDGKSALNLYGTAVTISETNGAGCLPTRNCQQGTFEGWEDLSGQTLTRDYLIKPRACYSCPIGCGRETRVDTPGPFQGQGDGPEYETIFAFGSQCGVNNFPAVLKANYLCNELGIDTISMGCTIACAMEMFEKGILTEEEVGRKLEFGDADAIVELTRKTAYREGFGDLLALGSLRLAEKYGHGELAMVSRGQEFAGYDPRGEQGMGLAYATSPIGASHMRGDPAYIELLGVPMRMDPRTWEDKPQIIKDWQDVFAIIDAAGLCVFFSIRNLVLSDKTIRPDGIMELINAATGVNYTIDEFVRAGERIFNAERQFLARAGFAKKDDSLPMRIVNDPLPDGPSKGDVCHLDQMLIQYYKLRGWDQNGIPTHKKLEDLELI
jgi:aldehyde:ferredoxin oxidoreductase